jgi:hypothetical protein
MRKATVFWLGVAAFCGTVLFHTSQQVTDGRARLATMEREMLREEESIRVLQAEWSYLNQPDRLEKLSAQYLQLEPLHGRQFATLAELAVAEAPAATDAAPVSAAPVKAAVAPTVPVPTAEKPAVTKPATEKPAAEKPVSRGFTDVMKSLGVD